MSDVCRATSSEVIGTSITRSQAESIPAQHLPNTFTYLLTGQTRDEMTESDGWRSHRVLAQASRRRRLPRWGVNLLAFPGVLGSAVTGLLIIPWYDVYGSWPEDGQELMVVFRLGIGLFVGGIAWVVTWCVTAVPSRRWWLGLLLITLAAPALVENALALSEARARVCDIRAVNGQDSRLHHVPWPLGPHCPYRGPTGVVVGDGR